VIKPHKKNGLTRRAWQPAITSLVESELDLAGATTHRSPENMHSDHIPFLFFSGLALAAGLYLFRSSRFTASLFMGAGILPTLGALSNSNRWPIPFPAELAMILGGVVLLIGLSVFVGATKDFKQRSLIPFWLTAVPSLLLGLWIAAMTIGLANLP
jgi:hypothetical protein